MNPLIETPARIYVTREDYKNETVLPALGEYAEEHDVDAITADLTEWHTEYNEEGLGLDARTGWMERPGVDFWEVVQRHALDEN